MDAEVAEFFRFKFCGMDEDSPSKRLARASQEINLYANLDEILFDFDHHEGAPIGGNIPLNPQWLNVLPQAYSQNQIAYSLGNQAALTDPTLFYYKDPNWFSFLNAFPTMLNDREKVSFLLNTYLNELMDLFLIGK